MPPSPRRPIGHPSPLRHTERKGRHHWLSYSANLHYGQHTTSRYRPERQPTGAACVIYDSSHHPTNRIRNPASNIEESVACRLLGEKHCRPLSYGIHTDLDSGMIFGSHWPALVLLEDNPTPCSRLTVFRHYATFSAYAS